LSNDQGGQCAQGDHDAIDIIYKKLQDDRDHADISAIIWELHKIVDMASDTHQQHEHGPDTDKIFDISKIDFDRLKEEFKTFEKKNTTTQCLKVEIEKRLKRMMERNPLRTDFYQRYQEIIAGYNEEKDRITIEETFAALLKFVEELDTEEKRAIREGLDEETLALFDLLAKPQLSTRDRNRLKKVAKELLASLKAEKLRVDNWREKDTTKAEVRAFIRDFLWSDETGLPATIYSPEDVNQKAQVVFQHVYYQYADAEHHSYAAA
jgi:type I restriction enzyme R subunit